MRKIIFPIFLFPVLALFTLQFHLNGSWMVFGRQYEYMTIDEYFGLHPEQVALSKRFNDRVRSKGDRIDTKLNNRVVRIAVIYPGIQISDYWRRSTKSFCKRMDEIGIKYQILEYFSKPTVDYRKQEQQLKAALEAETDYMVFTLDANKHKRLIERIIIKKHPKLILQNITTPLRAWEGKHPFLYVGFDHAAGAELLAKYFISRTGGKGHYSILYFTRGLVSTLRGNTFIRYTEKNSDLILSSSFYTEGKRQKSKAAAMEIIKTSQNIGFIYACSTDVAWGAIDALKDTGKLGKIMINGWGGGSSELEAIVDNEMDVTVMRMNDDNGVAMAEAIRLDLEGRDQQVPTIFSGEFTLVEKGIDSKELNRLKKRAFRYSGDIR
jgi:autoinducer 2-binding protein LuxP